MVGGGKPSSSFLKGLKMADKKVHPKEQYQADKKAEKKTDKKK